jgi:quinol monooxygenase YgiN
MLTAVVLIASITATHASAQVADSQPYAPREQQPVEAPKNADFVYFVSVKVKPDQVSAYKTIFAPYADLTRKEEGCVNYFVNQSPDDPTEFAIYEHWRSDEARAAHLAALYTVKFFADTKPMIETGYPVRKKFMELRSCGGIL